MALYYKNVLIAPNAKPTPKSADLLGTNAVSAFVKVDLPGTADLIGTKTESGAKKFVAKTVPQNADLVRTDSNKAFVAKTVPQNADLVGTDSSKAFVAKTVPRNAPALSTDADGNFKEAEAGSAKLPAGKDGDVYYLQPNAEPKQQQIMNVAVYVCENDYDISACLDRPLSFEEVLESWNRGAFTVNGLKEWGIDDDYPPLDYGGIGAEIANAKSAWAKWRPDANPLSDLTWQNYLETGDDDQLKNWITNINFRPAEPDGEIKSFYNDYGYGYWTYHKNLSALVQMKNSTDVGYFYSNQSYDKYHVKIRLRGLAADDDPIGFLAAIRTKPDGRHEPLFVLRRPDTGALVNSADLLGREQRALAGASNWHISRGCNPFNSSLDGTVLVYGKLGTELTSDALNSKFLLSALSSALSSSADPDDYAISAGTAGEPVPLTTSGLKARNKDVQWAKDYVQGNGWDYEVFTANWEHYADGVVIDVVRNENAIQAKTHRFDDPAADPELGYQLDLDLDQVEGFSGRLPIGFYSYSQSGTMLQILEFDIPKIIVDTRDNSVKEYYKAPGAADYEVTDLSGFGPQYVGIGRLTRNTATKKTFYVGATNFMRVVDDGMAQEIEDLKRRVAALEGH